MTNIYDLPKIYEGSMGAHIWSNNYRCHLDENSPGKVRPFSYVYMPFKWHLDAHIYAIYRT